MAETTVEHFVARVVVEKVTKTVFSVSASPQRTKHAIANIVVAGKDLESLLEKTTQHLGLVEDGGDIEEGKTHRG